MSTRLVTLMPGELFVGTAKHQVRTMLGSCVSITLWHPDTRCGGMSHFLLPTRGSQKPTEGLDGRYGDEALQIMINKLLQLGALPHQCQAKIFGGGDMFPEQSRHGTIKVGQSNGEAAVALLKRQGIELVSKSLFGFGHRQIIFELCNGHVWSRQISPKANELASRDHGGMA